MKKKVVAALLVSSMAMSMSAFGFTASAEDATEAATEAVEEATAGGDLNGDGKIIVGYISKNTVDVFHATLNGAAQERLDALVEDGTIDEWTGILDGNTDGAKQCDLAQDCINYPCDYVIILPAESTAGRIIT